MKISDSEKKIFEKILKDGEDNLNCFLSLFRRVELHTYG
jgi:hypothetical protein